MGELERDVGEDDLAHESEVALEPVRLVSYVKSTIPVSYSCD